MMDHTEFSVVTLLNMVLNFIQIAVVSWLAHRRKMADQRQRLMVEIMKAQGRPPDMDAGQQDSWSRLINGS